MMRFIAAKIAKLDRATFSARGKNAGDDGRGYASRGNFLDAPARGGDDFTAFTVYAQFHDFKYVQDARFSCRRNAMLDSDTTGAVF